METILEVNYKCSICGTTYKDEKSAYDCEEKPISQDKGVKVGDKVFILSGDGTGEIATVKRRMVVDKSWGHYAWERYWHTVMISADIDGSYGSRQLTFDAYEPVKKK